MKGSMVPFPNIRFTHVIGTTHYIGSAWKSGHRDLVQNAVCHNNNAMGQLGSLSNELMKTAGTELDPTICLGLCNGLAPCAYFRTNNNDIRTGMVAQAVKAALIAFSIPGTFGGSRTAPEELITQCY